MANVFIRLLDKGIAENILPAKTQEARDWFREQAESTPIRNPKTVINSSPIQTARTVTGFLYLFQYRPKMIDELPYHDRFPVVFPFRRVRNGFYGINMHYLPYTYRAILMDNLYDLAMDEEYDEETRLRLTYNILQSAGKFRFFKPCVRHYLNNHVQSRFALIPSSQWDIALFLPLERFVAPNGSVISAQRVHRNSVQKIRRG